MIPGSDELGQSLELSQDCGNQEMNLFWEVECGLVLFAK